MAAKKTKDQPTNPERLMLGYLCIKDAGTLQEEIKILDRFGLTNDEIVSITGKDARSIVNARYDLTRDKKSKE